MSSPALDQEPRSRTEVALDIALAALDSIAGGCVPVTYPKTLREEAALAAYIARVVRNNGVAT